MTQIYLIRHAEAEGNLYRRMHGQYNSGVTELGRLQIEALGDRFSDIPLDAVYASDLCRTMETAAVLCRRKQLPLHTEPRLREINVGVWEDMPFGNAEEEYPDAMAQFMTDPNTWLLQEAETYETVARRGVEALRDIAEANPGKSVAVAAHRIIISAVLDYLFPEIAGQGGSANTAVSLLTYENGTFSLVFSHNADHLGPAQRRVHLGGSGRDMWFKPLGDDVETYIRYRRDAWQVVYGDLRGFDGPGFWLDAQRTIGPDPGAMVEGFLGGKPVGMIQLSPDRDKEKGVGYIPFLYLRKDFRHQGLGIQLVGHAVSFYRKLGRKKLQLSVAPTNENALKFYEKFGFTQVKKQRGRFGYLLLMEKDISMPAGPQDIEIIRT